MKTNYTIENFAKRLMVIVVVGLMGVNAWGDAITTELLNFGTPIVSETFENCTASTSTSGNGSSTTIATSLSDYGAITHCYIGRDASNKFSIEGASDPMTSKYLEVYNSNTNSISVGLATSSTNNVGAFNFKIAKTSKAYIGLYTIAPNSNAIAYGNVAVFLQFTGSAIQIHNGTSGGWVNAVSSLPSTDILDVTIIYNNTTSSNTYGDDITISAKRAHIYVNGTAEMNGSSPKEFTIPGNTISYFNIGYGGSTATIKVDDIKIYDALPTVAGDAITLNKNNEDASGSSNGSARIAADATSMIALSAPTRIGYEVEGYYTSANCTTKVATNLGALQASVTVDAVTWTNGSSQWKKGGDATFYTKWNAKTYTVTLNDNSGSGGDGTKTVTFNANTNMTSAVTIPTRTHYIFGGYWTSANSGATLDTKVIDSDGTWVASVSGYTDATPNWIYAGDVTLYAKWTEHTYTNYRTRCCDPTELAFGSTYYTLTREDIQGSTTVWDTISITFSTSSSGTVTAVANGSSQTAWQFTGSGTWETRATTGGSAASATNHAVFKITDAANGKAIFCVKNNGGNTGQGTYRFGLTQAADGSYCESTVWCWADVTVRDKFVDAVNGNSTINRDGHGPGGEQMKTPAEADLTDVDECHETTRRLRGWIKETDLQTQYNDASKETGYLEDAANYNSSQIIAPYANITTSGCTWYAVWAEEE